jgi:hypothetical protein
MDVRAALAAVLLVASAAGCAHSKIRGSNIDDTEENRTILKLVDQYQQAMESLDSDAVLTLVSPRFFEDNGNTDREDDYDYEGLKSSLEEQFKITKRLQVELRVDNIKVEDEDGKAYAFLHYTYRAQSEYPSGRKWKTDSDRVRVEFERRDGKWLILSGL